MTSTRNREYLNYSKLGLLYLLLLTIDVCSLKMLNPLVIAREDSDMSIVEILNLFTVLEIFKMIIYLIVGLVRYFENLFEMVSGLEFENKDTVFKVLILIASVLTLFLEGIILLLIIMKTKFLPIFVVGGVLNSVYEIVTNARLLYVAVIKLKKLNNILEITRQEMEEEELDHTCIICLNDMESGKMLECKHVFHLKCLK